MLKVDEIKAKSYLETATKKLLAQSVATIVNGSLGMHYYGNIISLRHAGTKFDMKEQARVMHRTTWEIPDQKEYKTGTKVQIFLSYFF